LRFYGNGVNDIDRVKIRIDAPAVPADVGATDFTLEFWMKASSGDNAAGRCVAGVDEWINGHIIFDRDIGGAPQNGDYGIALFGTVLGFGVNNRNNTGAGICGTRNVADGQWHHVAVTYRRSDGQIRLFVDGVADGTGGNQGGDVSYLDGFVGQAPNNPFLVIGAEKHDAYPGPLYSYSGFIDEVRLSTALRYTGNFTPTSQPFVSDANTAALYHFDEGSGTNLLDSSGVPGGPSHGVVNYGSGGSRPAGPVWSSDTPFTTAPGPGALQFSLSNYSVNEAASTATIAVTRSGGTSGAVSVDYATSDGTATAGADYTAAVGTLTWSDGESGAKTFSVAIVNDTSPESSQTVNLTLSNPAGGATLGSPASAVLTIIDNDNPGTLAFGAATYSVNETNGSVTITVTRNGGTNGAVSVNYATSNGSATAGADYTATSGTLNWANGDASAKTFTVAIINDASPEPNETVNLTLSAPAGGATLDSPASAVLTIVDDESAPLPATSESSGGGGGCSMARRGATGFDPTLPALLWLSGWWIGRHRRSQFAGANCDRQRADHPVHDGAPEGVSRVAAFH
jgi:hypothetical protein